MSPIKEKKLGELFKIKHGFAFKGEYFADKGKYVVLTPGNFYEEGGFKSKGQKEKFYSAAFPPDYLLKQGDILVVMTEQKEGLLGSSAIVPRNDMYLHNQRLGLIVDVKEDEIDRKFIPYLFDFRSVRAQIAATANGAKVRHTSPSRIYAVKVKLPNVPTQKIVVWVLSRLDELIRNNSRRIELLEETAKLAYNEWFVKFRFPGYEKVKMVDSELGEIPEGWEVKKLNEVAKITDCFHTRKPLQATGKEEYGLLLHVWNIGEGGKIDLSNKFYVSKSDYGLWTQNIEVKEGDCVITNVGRIGAFAQIPQNVRAAIGRNMTAVRPREGIISPTYLIEYLRSPYFAKEKSLKQDSGAIMGSLNVRGIIKLFIPLPPYELVNSFENRVRPIRGLIELLQLQIANLKRTRDILLPKLVSGEIGVSNLDIKGLEMGE